MSELEDSSYVYKLYAVIVHVDMLNASFFGHYICYVKDFSGNWYRIDDCKVARVDLDEVLSQGAYMLLYSRSCPRSSCLLPSESLQKEQNENVKAIEVHPASKQPAECLSDEVCSNGHADSGKCSSPNIPEFMVNGEEKLILPIDIEDTRGDGSLPIVKDEFYKHNELPISQKQVSSPVNHDDPHHLPWLMKLLSNWMPRILSLLPQFWVLKMQVMGVLRIAPSRKGISLLMVQPWLVPIQKSKVKQSLPILHLCLNMSEAKMVYHHAMVLKMVRRNQMEKAQQS